MSDFNFDRFTLSDNNFKDIPRQVIELRTKLFLQFTKRFLELKNWIKIEGKESHGSLEWQFLRCKPLVLAFVKNKLLDEHIATLNSGRTPEVSVSRRKAMIFADSGQTDHMGDKTIFGQIFQQIKRHNPDFSNFAQKSTDHRCWKVAFRGEGSIDAGGPFRDSLVNISRELESTALPLLIESPNRRGEVGVNRECYMLNPESESPTHLEMFHFLGCMIAFGIMSKSPMPINLAPTVWKQLLNEKLTLNDLDQVDTNAFKLIKDLKEKSKSLSEEEFNALYGHYMFTTVLSHGAEVPLCDNGFDKPLRQDNVDEYVRLVLEARASENKKQIAELRRGVQTVMKDMSALVFMEWH